MGKAILEDIALLELVNNQKQFRGFSKKWRFSKIRFTKYALFSSSERILKKHQYKLYCLPGKKIRLHYFWVF